MVYTQLIIVYGAMVTLEDLRKVTDDVDEDGCLDNPTLPKLAGHQVEIFSFPCCSKSGCKLYVVGYLMHTYYRKLTRCDKCPSYCVCDECIGMTNNGYYNVNDIVDKPVEVNMRHLCLCCFADNKKDLNAPKESIEEKGAKFMNHCPSHESIPCETCGNRQDGRFAPETAVKRGFYHKALNNFLRNDCDRENTECKFYYMLNDCLSCT